MAFSPQAFFLPILLLRLQAGSDYRGEKSILSHLLRCGLPAQVGKTNDQNSTLGEFPGVCFSVLRRSVPRFVGERTCSR